MLPEAHPIASHATPTARGELHAFLGKFQREEPAKIVRARIDAAIEQAIAPLSWPLRVVARPAVRFVAQLPDWISIEQADGLLCVAFSSGVELRAPLGGESRPHLLPAATKAEVRHFLRDGRLRTEVVSEHGTIINVLEPSGADQLIGHAQLESPHIPLPISYTMRLARVSTSR